MAITGEIRILTIDVEFDPTDRRIHLQGDLGADDTIIQVPQGIGMIVFRLAEGTLSEPLDFPTYPIEWLERDGLKDTAQPPHLVVQRLDSRHCTIVDFNGQPGPDPIRHKFRLLVTTGLATYGTDPTIINEPPAL